MSERTANNYEVTVVGAGPGGAVAARKLGEEGFKVALLDKEDFPRFKPCGGMLSLKTMKELNLNPEAQIGERLIFGLRLTGQSGKTAAKRVSYPVGMMVRRERFDHYLVDEATKNGVDFYPSTVPLNIEQEGGRLKLTTNKGVFYTDKLIGADGVFSSVAKLAQIRKPYSKLELGFTVSTNVPGRVLPEDEDMAELYTIPFAAGFGWVFPHREGYTVGLGCSSLAGKKIYPYFLEFLERIGKLKSLSLKERSQDKGHYIPAGGFKRPVASGNVLLVGDAAGFVDPFSGEGIYYAVRSGLTAAEQIKLSRESADYALALEYTKSCYREFLLDARLSWLLALCSGNKEGTIKEKRVAEFITTMEKPNSYLELFKRRLFGFAYDLKTLFRKEVREKSEM